ncbi:MAG: TolC family protein [Gemmatimonadetes bacterium]|nr:TolC family protein [Gemmatimonadota bacterium]
MRSRTLVAALIATGLVGPGLAAQSADTLRLTLSTALDIAEGNNPTYRQASNSALLNDIEMRTTWFDQLLPRVNLQLFDTGFRGNIQRVGYDNFGNTIVNDSADWQYSSNTQQAMSFNWNVRGRSLLQAHRRQSITNEDRELSVVRALTGLQVQIQRLYMDALEQRDLMRAEEELVEARQIDMTVAERLFSLALRTRVDVLNAELAVEQQLLELQQQRATYEQAVLALRTQLGSEERVSLSLADEDLPIFDPSGLEVEQLVASALVVNPELRQSRLSIESASLGVQEAQNSWWPAVSMSVDVWRRSQPRGLSVFDVGISEPLEAQFRVQFSIPMFNNFFQNRQAMERAAVQLDNGREAEREARLRIEETVRSAVLEISNQYEVLRLAERSLEIAQEALRLAREEYRIGTRTFEDLRSSFDSEATTRRQVITARHSFVDAVLTLEEAVGARVRGGTPPIASGSGGR